MPHFLIKKEEINDNFITLKDNENLFHISKVLRAKIGEKIKFIDENQFVYKCVIVGIDKNSLSAEVCEKYKTDRILNYNVSLVQSILMNDAQNLAIANATQTGIKTIYPCISDNCAVNKKSLIGKVEKWNKIAYENFKQCERGDLAKVEEIADLKEILLKFKKENVLVLAEKYENYNLNNCLENIDKTSEIAIIVGPEGGFSKNEFKFFKENDFKLITLGKMIYKAPNAITVGVSNILSRLEC